MAGRHKVLLVEPEIGKKSLFVVKSLIFDLWRSPQAKYQNFKGFYSFCILKEGVRNRLKMVLGPPGIKFYWQSQKQKKKVFFLVKSLISDFLSCPQAKYPKLKGFYSFRILKEGVRNRLKFVLGPPGTIFYLQSRKYEKKKSFFS